jgi:hypothetical protein
MVSALGASNGTRADMIVGLSDSAHTFVMARVTKGAQSRRFRAETPLGLASIAFVSLHSGEWAVGRGDSFVPERCTIGDHEASYTH